MLFFMLLFYIILALNISPFVLTYNLSNYALLQLGFVLLALIWEYDFPPFMVLIIAILNDGNTSHINFSIPRKTDINLCFDSDIVGFYENIKVNIIMICILNLCRKSKHTIFSLVLEHLHYIVCS